MHSNKVVENSNSQLISPAAALWNQRFMLDKNRRRILRLSETVGWQNDLSLYQSTQLLAFTLQFKPDLILELGRGQGNSTCLFTEASNLLGPDKCRVVSLCLTDDFQKTTLPRILKIVHEDWAKPLQALKCDILSFDYLPVLAGVERCLVFWDAHGFEVAECVLGRILPLIADSKHLVVMHDLSDARYIPASSREYGKNRLWKGNNSEGLRVRLGHIDSAVEQVVSIVDFTSRNEITLESADHSLHSYFSANPEKSEEMKRLLGEELFSLQAHWFWFTLNEKPGPYTFPKFIKPVETRRTFPQRLHKAVSILLGWERF